MNSTIVVFVIVILLNIPGWWLMYHEYQQRAELMREVEKTIKETKRLVSEQEKVNQQLRERINSITTDKQWMEEYKP